MDQTSGLSFCSRRPVILSCNGAVACDCPNAARVGIDVLRLGGNAADAAVAMAATLNVTLPMSTGLGGDAFCLFYDAKTQKVEALNGSGRSPSELDLDLLLTEGYSESNKLPKNHGHCVTVPGAAAAWVDTVEKFGSKNLTLSRILQPAIGLAEKGFPVSEIAAYFWEQGSWVFRTEENKHAQDMLLNGNAPKWGQVFKNHNLAETLKELATGGKSAFYEGRIANAIVEAVQHCGGKLTADDLRNHVTTFEEPISTDYHGVRLWEIPPSGQGIVALMALNILKGFDLEALRHNSAAYLHHLIEALRLSFADAMSQVADMSKVKVPVEEMLDASYAEQRRNLINPDRAMEDPASGDLPSGTDTVYLTVTDKEGNACSFINSNYMGFGTGIVPKGCGFTLQNRGWGFSLQPGHLNVVAPNKRPFHTIIPAMLTDDKTGALLASYGVMGGFMQPQGHVQVLLNMLLFGMNPQQALDQPRFRIGERHTSAVGSVNMEKGISEEVIEELRSMGHHVVGPVEGHERAGFGRGHVITRGAWWSKGAANVVDDRDVWWAGSAPRADGLALGY